MFPEILSRHNQTRSMTAWQTLARTNARRHQHPGTDQRNVIITLTTAKNAALVLKQHQRLD
jgi:hypothetical protein